MFEGLKGPGASRALDGTMAPFAQNSPAPMRCTALVNHPFELVSIAQLTQT